MRIWQRVGQIAFLGAASATAGMGMQRNSAPPAPTPDYSASHAGSTANNPGGVPDLGDPSSRREMEERRGHMLNIERQKAMVREAGQIVQMSAELQQTLAKDPQGAAREEAVKRVETIEKLARNVKDRMKGGR